MGKVSCDYCRVSCTSPLSLAQHVIGQKHRANLKRIAPEELKELGRLQYFLDTHVKGQPVLGLEHLVETQVDSVYIYTCLLCNKELEWMPMISHVLDVEHMERYIFKHHSGMVPRFSHLRMLERNQEVALVAGAIHAKFGNGDICISQSVRSNKSLAAAAGPSSKGSVENGAEPSEGDHLQAASTKETPTEDSVTQKDVLDQKVIPKSSESKKPESFIKYSCEDCDVTCSSAVALCEHILGKVHKRNLEFKAPEELMEIGRLGYFLNTHLKDEPILGLEYIVEMKLGSLYKYTCLLCGVDTNIQKIVAHITDQDHGESYLAKHHKSLLPSVPKHVKKVYMKFLRKSALKVIEVHGRKEIHVKNSSVSDLIETKSSLNEEKMKDDIITSKADTENSSYLKRPPLPYREDLDESYARADTNKRHKNPNTDDPPLAKRGKYFHKTDWDDSRSKPNNAMHRGSRYNQRPPRISPSLNSKRAVQELEFRTNDQLVEYLSKFSIENDEDALFIQKITQNCINALKNFQEEESETRSGDHQTEVPLAHSSRSRRVSPDVSRHKSREHYSSKSFHEDESERLRVKRRAEAHSSRTHRASPDVSRKKSREHYSSKSFHEEDSERLRVKRRTEAHSSRTHRVSPDVSRNKSREPYPSKNFDDEAESLRVKHRKEVPQSHSSRTRRLSPDVSRSKSRDPRSYKEEETERLWVNRQTEVPLAHSSRSREVSPDVSVNKSTEPYAFKNFQEEDAERLKDKDQTEMPVPHSSSTRQMSPDVSANKSTEPPSFKNYQEEDAERPNRWTEVPLAHSSRTPPLNQDISALAHSSSLDVSSNKSTELHSFKNYQEEDTGVNRWTEEPLAHSSKTPQMSPDVSGNKSREPHPVENLQEEDAERLRNKHQTEVPLPPSSRTPQVSFDVSANKSREPHPSTSSQTTLPKNPFNPSSDSVPKNDITNFFFSSIKNMDESEVVGIFQKIVITNPEFQGMDIPAVIRFLKESGRLKTS